MKKILFFALVAILLMGCHSPKTVVTEEQYADAHFPVPSTDSLWTERDEAWHFTKISIVGIEDTIKRAYTQSNLGRDEMLLHCVRYTDRSIQITQEWATNGKIWALKKKLEQALSEQNRQKLQESDRLHIHIGYLLPLDDVLRVKVIRIIIWNMALELNTQEMKAFFDFAQNLPIEFEYKQYKDYTTGYVIPIRDFPMHFKDDSTKSSSSAGTKPTLSQEQR